MVSTVYCCIVSGPPACSSGRDKICTVWDLKTRTATRTVPVYEVRLGHVQPLTPELQASHATWSRSSVSSTRPPHLGSLSPTRWAISALHAPWSRCPRRSPAALTRKVDISHLGKKFWRVSRFGKKLHLAVHFKTGNIEFLALNVDGAVNRFNTQQTLFFLIWHLSRFWVWVCVIIKYYIYDLHLQLGIYMVFLKSQWTHSFSWNLNISVIAMVTTHANFDTFVVLLVL